MMSTTGNEFEQPGINLPDRKDADGAEATPAEGEPTREDVPPQNEPTHTAVGVGVVSEGADHHGQDGTRDTLTAGEAQREGGALGSEQTQNLPAMDQNNASEVEKVAGILAQTRSDVSQPPRERVVEVLHQRLEQAGIALPDAEVEELADQITTGDA
ncbi:hypothetical protein [Microbacterium sp. NPDC055357]